MAEVWFDCLKKEGKKDVKLKHYLNNYVHIIGGLSKDFGVSGMRIGIIYTHNEDILAANRSVYGYLQNVSAHTQYFVQRAFEDEKWLKDFVETF